MGFFDMARTSETRTTRRGQTDKHMRPLDVFRQAIRSTDPLMPQSSAKKNDIAFGPRLPNLKEMRRLLIEEALRRAQNNQSVAAQLLGITRQALNKHMNAVRMQ